MTHYYVANATKFAYIVHFLSIIARFLHPKKERVFRNKIWPFSPIFSTAAMLNLHQTHENTPRTHAIPIYSILSLKTKKAPSKGPLMRLALYDAIILAFTPQTIHRQKRRVVILRLSPRKAFPRYWLRKYMRYMYS